MNRRDWLVAFCESAMIVLMIAGTFLLVIGLVPAFVLHERTAAVGMMEVAKDMVRLLWDSPGSVIWQIGALHMMAGGVGLWWLRRFLGGSRERDSDQTM
jgi:uncharacterized protein YjeT (DUF2065 family)